MEADFFIKPTSALINTREARLLDPPRNLTSGLGPLYRDLLPAPLLVIYTRWSSSACRPGNSRLLIAGFIRNKVVNRVGFYVLCSLRPSLSPLLPLSPSLSLILSLPWAWIYTMIFQTEAFLYNDTQVYVKETKRCQNATLLWPKDTHYVFKNTLISIIWW